MKTQPPKDPPVAPAPRIKILTGPIKACPRWDLPPVSTPMSTTFPASFSTNRLEVQYAISISGDTAGGSVDKPTLTPSVDGTIVQVTLPNVTGIYYLQIAPTSAPGFSHTVEILYNPMSAPLSLSLSGSPPPGTYAPGTLVALTATATGGTMPYSYEWTFNGSSVSSTDSTIYVRLDQPGSMYSFSVKVTDNAGATLTQMVGYGTTM